RAAGRRAGAALRRAPRPRAPAHLSDAAQRGPRGARRGARRHTASRDGVAARVGVSDERWDELYVPDDLEAGVYASAVTVWHTAHDFTLDFVVEVGPDERRGRVVARVHVPTTLMLDLLQKASLGLTAYEEEHG